MFIINTFVTLFKKNDYLKFFKTKKALFFGVLFVFEMVYN